MTHADIDDTLDIALTYVPGILFPERLRELTRRETTKRRRLMTTAKAIKKVFSGPDRDGCSDLPEIDLKKWFELGGDDIAVDCGRWTVIGTAQSIAYVVKLYSLSE